MLQFLKSLDDEENGAMEVGITKFLNVQESQEKYFDAFRNH